jgi:hypothetical protein
MTSMVRPPARRAALGAEAAHRLLPSFVAAQMRRAARRWAPPTATAPATAHAAAAHAAAAKAAAPPYGCHRRRSGGVGALIARRS